MPGTVVQELLRILRRRRRCGERCVWLSPENQAALLGITTRTPVPLRPAPSPAPPAARTAPAPAPAPAAATSVVPAAAPGRAPSGDGFRRAPIEGDYAACASLDLAGLSEAVRSCEGCGLCRTGRRGPLGEGVPGARLMFVCGHAGSAAPGTPAGTMLTNIITAMLKMERGGTDPATGAYVCSVLKCSAAGRRLTDAREVEACMGFLRRQVELVRPEVIVLMGALPMRCLLGLVGVQKFHGQWFRYLGIPAMPVIEPEFILRFQKQKSFFLNYKRQLWNDLKQALARLAAPAPAP